MQRSSCWCESSANLWNVLVLRMSAERCSAGVWSWRLCAVISRSGDSSGSIAAGQVQVCPLLFLLQLRLRPAHVPGLRRVPGRFSVHPVHAGHRHRRLPASAPHRWQRRELQGVGVLVGRWAPPSLPTGGQNGDELWSTHAGPADLLRLPLTDAAVSACFLCSVAS